jgi:hypothetical protein
MTQNPLTPSSTSYEPESTLPTPGSTQDDATSVTSAPPTGTGQSIGTSSNGSSFGVEPGGNGRAASVRDEAASVTSDAAESGRQVAGAAVSEAKDVVAEARSQMSTLLHQLRGEATDQASAQSDRAVQGLRALGDELRQMASSSGQKGLATDLAGQAADRVQSFAGWLDHRQPGEVLDEVRDFARRRPGTFLAAAAVVGLVGGRLTRGIAAGSGGSPSSGPAGTGTGYAPGSATSVGTDQSRLDAGLDPVVAAPSRSTPGAEDSTWAQQGTEGTERFEGIEDGPGVTGPEPLEGVEYRQGLR